ncbi:hypothetical protein AXA44_12240 [Rhodococcus sp. SC4]|nr:hypothetical protein AXA44_12240 [Rhodococcus sp. SC4]
MRRKNAKFSTGKTFSSWRPEESSIPEAIQNALTTLEWVHRRENLAVSGASVINGSSSTLINVFDEVC